MLLCEICWLPGFSLLRACNLWTFTVGMIFFYCAVKISLCKVGLVLTMKGPVESIIKKKNNSKLISFYLDLWKRSHNTIWTNADIIIYDTLRDNTDETSGVEFTYWPSDKQLVLVQKRTTLNPCEALRPACWPLDCGAHEQIWRTYRIYCRSRDLFSCWSWSN